MTNERSSAMFTHGWSEMLWSLITPGSVVWPVGPAAGWSGHTKRRSLRRAGRPGHTRWWPFPLTIQRRPGWSSSRNTVQCVRSEQGAAITSRSPRTLVAAYSAIRRQPDLGRSSKTPAGVLTVQDAISDGFVEAHPGTLEHGGLNVVLIDLHELVLIKSIEHDHVTSVPLGQQSHPLGLTIVAHRAQ